MNTKQHHTISSLPTTSHFPEKTYLSSRSKSFFRFFSATIDNLVRIGKIGTALNYRTALASFSTFRHGTDINLDRLNTSVIEGYQDFLTSRGICRNSSSFYMRILRAVYNRAVRQNIVKNRSPFANVFTGSEKTLKRAVSFADLQKIRNINLSKHPHLIPARDFFFFLFFCRGMSFIDAACLTKDNISNGYISYKRRKTGKKLRIRIIPQIRNITCWLN